MQTTVARSANDPHHRITNPEFKDRPLEILPIQFAVSFFSVCFNGDVGSLVVGYFGVGDGLAFV
jgi:hypothetical protein